MRATLKHQEERRYKDEQLHCIYPEDLAFPVHPNPSLTAHLQEAFVDLKANEARIANSPTTN